MSPLVTFISFTLQASNFSYIPTVKNIALQYFNRYDSVTIITENNSKWDFTQFSIPIKIQSIGFNISDPDIATSVILHSNKTFSESILSGITWNCDTKFLLVSENGCPQNLVTHLWRRSVCHLLVLSATDKQVQICEGNNWLCPYDSPNTLPILYSKRSDIKRYVLKPQLKQCTLNVSYMDLPPYVFCDGKKMGGNEGEIVAMALNSLGVNMKFINRQQTNWGWYDPPTGLIGDVVSGQSVIGVGGLYPFTERFVKANAVQFCLPVHIGFVVPKGAGPHGPSYLVILISEFSTQVWIATLIAYIFLIPAVAGLERFKRWLEGNKRKYHISWTLKIYQIILGMPAKGISSRTVMITCIWYGFLLGTMYKSLMSSKLTAPSKIPDITTLKGIIDAKMMPTGPINTGIILKTIGSGNNYLKYLGEHHVDNGNDTHELVKSLVMERKSAIFRHILHLIYTSLSDPELTGKIHVVEEKSAEVFTLSLMKKGTCFKRDITRKFAQICEGGFVSKSLKDASDTRSSNTKPGPRKLAPHDIEGFLYLTALGWIISLLFFMLELLVHKCQIMIWKLRRYNTFR